MLVSHAFVSLLALKQESVRSHLVRQFTHALSAPPDAYEWQYLPKNYPLEMEDGSVWVLPRPFAQLWAFSEPGSVIRNFTMQIKLPSQ